MELKIYESQKNLLISLIIFTLSLFTYVTPIIITTCAFGMYNVIKCIDVELEYNNIIADKEYTSIFKNIKKILISLVISLSLIIDIDIDTSVG